MGRVLLILGGIGIVIGVIVGGNSSGASSAGTGGALSGLGVAAGWMFAIVGGILVLAGLIALAKEAVRPGEPDLPTAEVVTRSREQS